MAQEVAMPRHCCAKSLVKICLKTCLERTQTSTNIIGPVVQLLDEREADVTREAAIALTKFACTEKYLHVDHSKAIINFGCMKHLIELVFFGK
ncbi:hypothetical protein Syun_027312 [Stephania yunnanensis]|uniref:Uncharacterized protein n=1 Tax=Stephania yunnanensis TaxID=152371 RepID=A0AAP0HQ37_9MAGN